jgi:hypothetical protein
MPKPTILVQLDTDDQPSVFDSVVAVDSGVEHLFRHHGITPENVRDRVYGAIFTRGGDDLARTAIFIGGSDVRRGEAVLKAVKKAFFGPMRVSVMIDSGGANTTAVAAVLAVERHVKLSETTALVLAATGPVGQRAARLLARQGAKVRIASRDLARAEQVVAAIREVEPNAALMAVATSDAEQTAAALADVEVIIAAGAAGVELASVEQLAQATSLKVAVDLNAVPPAGLGGIEVMDRGQERNGVYPYGAIGVGGTKMKIHKAAVRSLFERNDRVLDAVEIYELGKSLS